MAGGSGTSNEASALAGSRPNVILFLTDDLGWGDLGCYGHQHIRTPNLDGLAGEGTLFTQFYSNSGVCSPSRTSWMTGEFPARHGIHGHLARVEQNERRGMPNYLDPDVATVTGLLQEAGYATGHFGKWHLGGSSDAPEPGAYGIDDHCTTTSNGPGWDTSDEYFRAKSTRLIVDATLRFIEENRDRPFYVNLWTLLPHATLHPTDEQMEPYERFGPQGVPHKGALQIYYASVSDIDRQMGRLVEGLERLGVADNTLVVFSSDNGPEDIVIRNASHSGVGSPGPFRGRKRSLYEGGVRMPLIARWPEQIAAGHVEDDAVLSAVDWLPTLCNLAGIEAADVSPVDGEDVTGLIAGSGGPRRTPIMWEWRFRVFGHVLDRSPMLSIREGNWKLLMNPDRSRIELYDIPQDPTELDNVADDHGEVVEELSEKVLAWQEELPEGPIDDTAGANDYPWPE